MSRGSEEERVPITSIGVIDGEIEPESPKKTTRKESAKLSEIKE